MSNKQFEERLKNDDLLRDLHDIDRLARKVQADKEYTVEAADRELTEAKVSEIYSKKSRQNVIVRSKLNTIIENFKHLMQKSPV